MINSCEKVFVGFTNLEIISFYINHLNKMLTPSDSFKNKYNGSWNIKTLQWAATTQGTVLSQDHTEW